MPIPQSKRAAVFLRILLHLSAIFRLYYLLKCVVSRDENIVGGTQW